jgi:hypothetical protein
VSAVSTGLSKILISMLPLLLLLHVISKQGLHDAFLLSYNIGDVLLGFALFVSRMAWPDLQGPLQS